MPSLSTGDLLTMKLKYLELPFDHFLIMLDGLAQPDDGLNKLLGENVKMDLFDRLQLKAVIHVTPD